LGHFSPAFLGQIKSALTAFLPGVFRSNQVGVDKFKEEAVRLSQEIGVRRAAEQLGLSYHTLSSWRRSKKEHGEKAFVGSGRPYLSDDGMSARELELQREVNELRIANEIL
jgi:transposase